MKHRVLVVGKPALAFARSGIEDYFKRLKRYGNYSLEILRDTEAQKLAHKFLESSQGSFRIVLDERGQTPTTRQFSDKVKAWTQDPAIKEITYLIGPANGHLPETRNAGNYLLALSKLTLQHEVATLLLAEQLYRVASIHAGSPYHRD